MGVTQYIGARYMPIFADPPEHSSAKTYEPLTIVLHEGNSYTSKQFVPKGIDITNETYWAETGNFNGQVEAYRRQVIEVLSHINDVEDMLPASSFSAQNTVENSISNLSKSINQTVSLYAPDINGSAVIAKYDDVTILFDCASESGASDLRTYLNLLNVTHIDAVVITHMHYDHAGGFNAVIPFCDASTDIYVQMPCTTANSQYSTYENTLTNIRNLCQANGLNMPVVPNEGSSHTYGNGTITFRNTNYLNQTIYDNAIANTNSPTGIIGGLNNYSLISILSVGDFTYIDTGDIEGEAQRLNWQYMRKCNVARNPHHFANFMGYFKFYNTLAPDVWLVTLTGYTETTRPADTYFPQYCYLYRYADYGYTNTVIYPNGSAVEITWKNDFTNVSGERMRLDSTLSDATQATIYTALPPYYYNADPFILFKMTIAEFKTATRNAKQKDLAIYASSDFATNSVLYQQLAQLMNTTATILVSVGAQIMHAHKVSMTSHIVDAYFFASYTDENFGTGINYKLCAPIASNVVVEYETAIGQDENIGNGISSTLRNMLLNSTVLVAVITGGAMIPLIRTESPSSGDSGYFSGVATNATGTTLRSININTSGTITLCTGINIADGTRTPMTITRLESIL